jgi:hypothetical protein
MGKWLEWRGTVFVVMIIMTLYFVWLSRTFG